MSQQFVAEFQQLPDQSPEHDMMARLYREIGLSAVAAALEVMDMPSPATTVAPVDQRQIPAFLQEDSLAA
ncbi:MAG: hypothetical protein WAK03_01420 [Methylocystis sp.]|jgi:hypothetical protein